MENTESEQDQKSLQGYEQPEWVKILLELCKECRRYPSQQKNEPDQ